jgi:uncharacterized protein (TIGR02594 family)
LRVERQGYPVSLAYPWVDQARKYIGLKEIPGPRHNSTIIRWLTAIRAPFLNDEAAWCGSGLGGIFLEVGIKPPKRCWGARNWLQWEGATKLKKPTFGAVVVFWRGSRNGWAGHVGIIVGRDQYGNLIVRGCNQKNSVRDDPFPLDRVLAYLWPPGHEPPAKQHLRVFVSGAGLSVNEA